MAAPSLLVSGTVIADTATPYSCAPVVDAHAVNDILLSPCITSGAQAHTLAGTGWVLVAAAIAGTHRVSYAWKRATATTGEGPTWTASGGTGTMFSNVIIFRGCETTGTPWDSVTAFGDATTADTSPDAPAFTTLGTDRLVVAAITGVGNGTPTATSPWAIIDNSSSATAPTMRTIPLTQTVTTAQSVGASQLCTLATYTWAGFLLPMFSPGGGAAAGSLVIPPARAMRGLLVR